VEDADVGERAAKEEVGDPWGVEPPLELGLVEGVVGVFDDDEFLVGFVPRFEFVDQFGLPRAFEDA